MRRWRDRSVYWREVALNAILFAAFVLAAIAATRWYHAFALLVLPVFVAIAAAHWMLRCPKCGDPVNYPRRLWVGWSSPSKCSECGWPTSKPAPAGLDVNQRPPERSST